MVVRISQWNAFLFNNAIIDSVISRHPITNNFPEAGEEVLDLSTKCVRYTTHADYIILPDDWFLPRTIKRRPPINGKNIYNYTISYAGWYNCRDIIRLNWKHQKCTFEQYEDLILNNINHYNKTLAARRSVKHDS